MKTKRKVKQAKDEKKDFPGYPLYDPSEDIMNRGKRVDADLENPDSIINENVVVLKNSDSTEKKIKRSKDEFAVTKEDMEALGPKDLSLDMGEDEELLKHRITPIDFSGKDLDIPGSELDDASESIGAEDEENNSYSLGGDDHNDLEEDKS